MQIGIFSRTFTRPTLEETLDAVAAHGLYTVQFDMSGAGVKDLPDEIPAALSNKIRTAMAARQVTMAAVSGTYNMIDPDVEKRQAGLRRLRVLAAACKDLGTSVITLCTGTRNPDSMWRNHPDNGTPEAWRDLTASMSAALTIAQEYQVTLGIEPEVNNTVDSAQKARRLLDEMQSPHLKIVMDGANIFHTGELPQMAAILDRAFELLGNDLVLAHAKDLDHDGDAGHLAAGHGLLDYERYLRLLNGSRFAGPLILHGLTENQVDGCVAFLREKQGKAY